MAKILIKRGTRAELDAAAGLSGLNSGEPYLVTDEDRLAWGVATDSYADAVIADDLLAFPTVDGTRGFSGHIATSNGGLSLAGSAMVTTLTPAGASVASKLDIPAQVLPQWGQLVALGCAAASHENSRVLSILDGRTGAHHPSLAVLNPVETDIFGLSWNGSNSIPGIQVQSAAAIAIRFGVSTEAAAFASNGDFSFNGTLLGGTVPWARLSNVPSFVAAGADLATLGSASADTDGMVLYADGEGGTYWDDGPNIYNAGDGISLTYVGPGSAYTIDNTGLLSANLTPSPHPLAAQTIKVVDGDTGADVPANTSLTGAAKVAFDIVPAAVWDALDLDNAFAGKAETNAPFVAVRGLVAAVSDDYTVPTSLPDNQFNHYLDVDTAGVTITLPASPAIGDQITVGVGAFADTVLARNGQLIQGLAENLILDVPNSVVRLKYVYTHGWRIL